MANLLREGVEVSSFDERIAKLRPIVPDAADLAIELCALIDEHDVTADELTEAFRLSVESGHVKMQIVFTILTSASILAEQNS